MAPQIYAQYCVPLGLNSGCIRLIDGRMVLAGIHGLNKASNVTVFPHAIAQGATWDQDLVTQISNATAIEARILTAKTYMSTKGGNSGAALSCDGGPLANSAHDPRW